MLKVQNIRKRGNVMGRMYSLVKSITIITIVILGVLLSSSSEAKATVIGTVEARSIEEIPESIRSLDRSQIGLLHTLYRVYFMDHFVEGSSFEILYGFAQDVRRVLDIDTSSRWGSRLVFKWMKNYH